MKTSSRYFLLLLQLLVFLVAGPASADENEIRLGLQAGGAMWWVPPSRGDGTDFGAGWTVGGSASYGLSDAWALGLEGYYNGIVGDLSYSGVTVGDAHGKLYEEVNYFSIGAFTRWTIWGRNVTPYLAAGVGVYSSNHSNVDLYTPDESALLLDLEDERMTNAYFNAGLGLEWRFLDYFFLAAEARVSVLLGDRVSAHLHLPVQLGYYF